MKKKGLNLYLFLIIILMVLIIFLAIIFLYKPITRNAMLSPNPVSNGLIASYSFEGNSNDNQNNNNGIQSEAFTWKKVESMNNIPNSKDWKFAKSACTSSVRSGELVISTKYNNHCSYAANNVVNFANGFTYEAKIKATVTNPIAVISIANGNVHSNLWLNTNKACLNKNETCTTLNPSQYHVYRVTIKDKTAKLWVDNSYIGSAPTQTSSTKANFIKFGDIDKAPASANKITFDYLKYYYGSEDSPLLYESGKTGKAVSFDGTSDYITIQTNKRGIIEGLVNSLTNQINPNAGTVNPTKNIVDGKSQVSVSTWVKVKSFATPGSIISKSNASAPRTNAFVLKTLPDKTIQFELDSSSNIYIVKTPQLNANTWYHILGTYDGSEMKIYTNGVLSQSKPRTGKLLNLSHLDLNIGANSIQTEFFNGMIDELYIYGRTLNASEIKAVYAGNCNVQIAGKDYTLEQDNMNPSMGESYICNNRDIYSCKEYLDDFATKNASNLQQIGSWQCNLDTEKWINIIPRFVAAVPSCSYGSNCGPFTITSAAGNISYELKWDYYLKNSSIISYISDSNFIAQFSQVISTDTKEIVDKVVLKVASTKDNQISKFTEIEIPITYNCINECNYIGQVQCNETVLSKRKLCGSYNISNACLTWGPLGDCGNNKICKNSQCMDGANIDTCTNVPGGGICLNSVLANAIQITGDCSEPGYNCYQCNSSKNYTWDPLFLKCIRNGCVNTCTINKGICQNNNLGNSSMNSSLDCCDTGDCYICNTNYHPDNKTCVNNMCSGNLPTTAGQNGTLIGVNNFTIGPTQNWAYRNWSNSNTELFPCQWKCASGYRRITNEIFDGCIEGLAPCETNIGCKNETIANAIVVEGNCSAGATCYQCNQGFNWSNNTCMSTCPNNGCIYEDICLIQSYRMLNNENNKVYCFNKTMQEQKEEDISCNQNYECISNYCRSGNCTSLLSEIHKTRASTERLVCWIKKLFNSAEIC